MWVIVRPKPKLQQSVSFLAEHGLVVQGFAPMDIKTCPEALTRLSGYLHDNTPDACIVTSTEAASRLLTIDGLPNTVNYYCVGSSSNKVMHDAGLECHVPELQSSEGLLAMPQLHAVSGKKIAMIKGVGGRTLLKTTLAQRGASVEEFAVYERTALSPPFTTGVIDWKQVKGVMVTSRELLEKLLANVELKLLIDKIFVGASDRICEFGKAQGLEEFYSSHGATDAHLLGWAHRHGEVGHDRT